MKRYFAKFKKYWNSHPFIASMIVFVLVFVPLIILYVISAGDPTIGDHYFHFKYAQLLRTEGLDAIRHFDWISPAGEIGIGSRYAVSLFQVSLIPFTYFSNTLLALYIVDVFHASATIALMYYVMRKARVKYAFLFTIGLFTIGIFALKLLFGRAFVFAITLLFLEMWLTVEKKYRMLFFVTIFHILWHQNTYFMPLVVVSMIEVARYLVENKIYIKNIFATLFATVIGMTFFPGFPHSLFGWIQNIFKIQSTEVGEVGLKSIGGGELATKDFMGHFMNQEILIFLFIFCGMATLFVYFGQKKGELIAQTKIMHKQFIWIYGLFIFMISLMFGTMAVSGRFYDFLIPTFFILSGFLFTVISKSRKITIDYHLTVFVKIGIIGILFVLIMNTFINIYIKANRFDYTPSQKTAQWIEQNSDKRERVFLDNWSLFTFMFFTNSYNVYTTGIEPMSLKYYDESLYWKYYNIYSYAYYCEKQGDCKGELDQVIAQMKVSNDDVKNRFEKENGRKIIESIRNDFDAKFIVSSSDKFTKSILLNPDLIVKHKSFSSKKFKGQFMQFTVFELK